MKARLRLALALIVLAGLLGGASAPDTAYVSCPLRSPQAPSLSVIVTAASAQAAARAVTAVGGSVTGDLWLIDAVAATVPAERLRALAAWPGIRSIAANRGVKAAGGPFWDGYVTSRRVLKGTYSATSRLHSPATYLPDGGFMAVDESGNALFVNGDGSVRARVALPGGPYTSAPAVGGDGTVYVAGRALHIHALNPDGSTRWQYTLAGGKNRFLGGVALGPEGSVYATDSVRTTYALDGATGVLRWRLSVGKAGTAAATPTVGPDGTIYFATDKGYVHALNPSGTPRWSHDTGMALDLSPVVGANGVVYVVHAGGRQLQALDAASGAPRFSFTTAGAVYANPVLRADGSVYLACEAGLYGLDAEGRQRFYFPAVGGPFKSSPVLSADGTTAYVAVAGRSLFALDADTGGQRWMYVAGGDIQAGPALDPKGNLAFGTDGGKLEVVSPVGQMVQRLVLSDAPTQAASAAANGDLTLRVGAAGLVTYGLLPSRWDGRPDVQPLSNETRYKLVNPVAIDVGADVLQETPLTPARNIQGNGITVAVVDSGIYFDSDTINTLGGWLNRQFLGQADFVDPVIPKPNGNPVGVQYPDHCFVTDKQYCRDGYGHGTHVAGIIWSNLVDDNTGLLMGIAPDVRIVGVRVLGDNGSGSYETVIKGIQWAVANRDAYNIRVLNLSLSATPTTPYFADPLDRAVEQAWASGIVVLAAAGNDGPAAETITVPGNDPYVITSGERILCGSQTYCPEDVQKALDLIASGRVDARKFITHRLPISELQRGFDIVDKKLENCVRVILEY